MANHWSTIQTACNKCHGIVEEVATSPESGANVKGQMLRVLAMYRADNEDQEFRFLHVFSWIDSGEKWREVRLALDKAKETYNLNAPAPAAAEGRPDGTKKVRAARDAAPAAQRLQALIEQCIADVKSSAVRREEKSDARWSAMMINIATKKRNTDLECFMGADTSTMDEKVKAWYIVHHDLILSQMPAPSATTMTITTTITTTTNATATAITTVPGPNAEHTPTASPTMPMTNNLTTPIMSLTTPTATAIEDPHPAKSVV
ncbi:putative methionyl-tRNA synthetase [Hordeum vulgare]|nr:putative methionyl-tRNA synthetase [Hordeum vulgare]